MDKMMQDISIEKKKENLLTENQIPVILRNRESAGYGKIDLKKQLQLFYPCKMTVDTPKRHHEVGKIDTDVKAQILRTQCFEKIAEGVNDENEAKIYMVEKSVFIDGKWTYLSVFYSVSRWNMMGCSVLQERTFEKYILMTIDLLSRLSIYLTEEEQKIVKFTIIQEETVYNKCGHVDELLMSPNNTSNIVMPKTIYDEVEIFNYMSTVFDNMMIEHQVQTLAHCRKLWRQITNPNSHEAVPRRLKELVTSFGNAIKEASIEKISDFDYIPLNDVNLVNDYIKEINGKVTEDSKDNDDVVLQHRDNKY